MQIYIDFNVGMISHGKVCTLTTDVGFIFGSLKWSRLFYGSSKDGIISRTYKNKSFSDALYDQVTAATEQL